MNHLIPLLSSPQTDVILPSDSRYEKARLIYNRMHDAYPGVIIRTLDIDDLRTVIQFALTNTIVLAIRGGGHHIGGFGTCHGGIVLDFSTFKTINHDKKIASVLPGATLADMDKVLCHQGYVVPTGTISETGIAGLTLGGGIGWMIGRYGLTCDQLCGADVLLANGELVRAEDPGHEDLLWALRGGGGNFGIVTCFRYNLNPLPKTICGMGVVAWKNATSVLIKLFNFLDNVSPAMTIAPVLTKNKNGEPCLRIDFCCANGTKFDVENLLSLSDLITWSNVREWEFSAWQKAFDDMLVLPKRGYWKAAYMEKITQEKLLTICKAFEDSPMGDTTIMIEHLHGAFKDYGNKASAFPLRHTNFGILFSARWENKHHDEINIQWVRKSFNAIDPNGLSEAYVNYTFEEDQRAIQSLLTHTKSQIAKVKLKYDPNNFFKRNHNVIPINIASAIKETVNVY